MAKGSFERRDYSKIPDILELPDLIEIQMASYEFFLKQRVTGEQLLIGLCLMHLSVAICLLTEA